MQTSPNLSCLPFKHLYCVAYSLAHVRGPLNLLMNLKLQKSLLPGMFRGPYSLLPPLQDLQGLPPLLHPCVQTGRPTRGERVGLRGSGFLGGLSLWECAGDLGGAAGGLLAGMGGRAPLASLGEMWGDGAGRSGRTTFTS